MQIEPNLSSQLVEYIRGYLMDRQIDPAPLLKQHNLPMFVKSDNTRVLPMAQVVKLLQAA